jgi:hypothetical protein
MVSALRAVLVAQSDQSRKEKEMSTAFAIVLFVLVYAPVAYMVYSELTGRRFRVRLPRGRTAAAPSLASGQRNRSRIEIVGRIRPTGDTPLKSGDRS